MNFSFTPQDVDQLTKTVLGEALGEDDNGKIAVMNVVLNRLSSKRFNRSGKKSITDIVRYPYAFSAWNPGKGGNELVKKGPGDKDYEYTKGLVLDFLKGNYADNTGGATHYYAPDKVDIPAYYNKNEYKDAEKLFTKVGKHTFMSTPEDGVNRADYVPSSSNTNFLAKSKSVETPLIYGAYSATNERTPAEMLMQGSDMSEDSLQNLANVLEQRKKKAQGFFARILGNAISGKGRGSLF